MPDSDAPAADLLVPPLERAGVAAILSRLDRIERQLAAIHATDCERRLLPLIAINTAGSSFTAGELYRHAQLVPELHGALLETVGPTEGPRRLGKLLERLQGKAIAGVEVQRVTVESSGVLWMCRFTATAPVAGEVQPVDDVDEQRESA